jgi:hypothetical protein
MSEEDDLKKIWKKEKDQLKKDLNSREKIIIKNEVPIRFGVKKKVSPPAKSPQKGNSESDSFLRSQLGL